MNYTKNLYSRYIIKQALKEDIGRRDITTESIIPKNKFVKAILLAKEDCVVCGLALAGLVFKLKDNKIQFKRQVKDGQKIKKGKVLARLWGRAQSILTAERVALNFVSLLSGIATKTRGYIEEVKPRKVKPVRNNKVLIGKISNGVKIMDTRKTIPGLRELEKYAVRKGGGYNHRMRLDQMILVKDNHLKVIGGYERLPKITKGYKNEVEVKNLKEFKQALKLKPDIIMLDNMSIKDIKKAVEIRNNSQLLTPNSKLKLEASGGITLETIREVASTGIDMISFGELTHSVNSIDISLEII